MCCQDKNFDVQVGQSKQLVQNLKGVGGAAVAKPLPKFTHYGNGSGMLCLHAAEPDGRQSRSRSAPGSMASSAARF